MEIANVNHVGCVLCVLWLESCTNRQTDAIYVRAHCLPHIRLCSKYEAGKLINKIQNTKPGKQK